MTERWTDERLDRFADKMDRLGEDIQKLIEALYLELPTIKAEIHAVALEANESRDVFHTELVEIKEVVKQQALSADRMAIAAQIQAEAAKVQAESAKAQSDTAKAQADTAKVQAENIRMMIEMVNRRQA